MLFHQLVRDANELSHAELVVLGLLSAQLVFDEELVFHGQEVQS